MSKSIIVIISIIILVIGISYGAYWYLNLPQVTAPVGEEKLMTKEKAPVSLEQSQQIVSDWEIYENKKYNFSIKYLKGWCITTSTNITVTFTSYPCDVYFDFPPPKKEIGVNIDIYPSSPDTPQSRRILPFSSVNEWVNFFGSTQTEKRDVVVDGEKGLRVKEEDSYQKIFYGKVRIIKDGIGYEFTYVPYDSDLVAIFDQLLNSFKFTK